MKECFTCSRCFGDHNEICDLDKSLLKQTLIGLPIINNRYRLDERLGAGSLGVSYLAYDIDARKKVVLKVVLTEYIQADPGSVPIFLQEVEAASAIVHPGVVRIFDYDKSPADFLYVVMEYLDGPSLKKILKQGPLTIDRSIRITCAICEAVAAAHKRGQLHREIKPSNVIVMGENVNNDSPASTKTGEIVKVLDFGISRMKSPEMLGVMPPNKYQPPILGMPYYVSPEQCEGEEIDERSEIYSIGIILYHMLTGDVPFKGSSYPALLEQHVSGTPAVPRSIRPDIPENIEEVILRAIEKDPSCRFQSVLAFANVLQLALKQPATRRRTVIPASVPAPASGPANLPASTPINPPTNSNSKIAPPLEAGEEKSKEKNASKELSKELNKEPKKSKEKEEKKIDLDLQEVVSDILATLTPPPSKRSTKRLKQMRRTQEVERVDIVEPPPEDLFGSEQKPGQVIEAPVIDFEKSQPVVTDPTEKLTPPPILTSSSPGMQIPRKKLPPPPPHEDKPEHYRRFRTTVSAPAVLEELRGELTGEQQDAYAPTELLNASAVSSSTPSSSSSSSNSNYEAGGVCLIEPPVSEKNEKAAQRPVALSPASIVYLFPDKFLPPKKLRQFRREMHNFYVIERESLAATLVVQAIISLRRRNSIRLSPVNAIVPILRRKLTLQDNEKFVLQLVNGAVRPLDVLENQVLYSLGMLNAASLRSIFLYFYEESERKGRTVSAAEVLNDTIADELAQYKLIEKTQRRSDLPLDPGESDRFYKANDDEIGRYFSQLDDTKELISTVKAEPTVISMGGQRLQLYDYLFQFYKELFLQDSNSLVAAAK